MFRGGELALAVCARGVSPLGCAVVTAVTTPQHGGDSTDGPHGDAGAGRRTRPPLTGVTTKHGRPSASHKGGPFLFGRRHADRYVRARARPQFCQQPRQPRLADHLFAEHALQVHRVSRAHGRAHAIPRRAHMSLVQSAPSIKPLQDRLSSVAQHDGSSCHST